MKTRNGFVSNSSSSSYVVYLPDNFKLDLKSEDVQRRFDDTYGEDGNIDEFSGEVQEAFEALMAEGEVDTSTEGAGALEDLLANYVIASFGSGPDGGCIVLANKERIRKIEREG